MPRSDDLAAKPTRAGPRNTGPTSRVGSLMTAPRRSSSSRSPSARSTSWQVGDFGYWQCGRRWYLVKILSVDMKVINLNGSAGERRLTIEPQEGPKRGSTWLVPFSNVRRAQELSSTQRAAREEAITPRSITPRSITPRSITPRSITPRSTSWQVGDFGYWQRGKRWHLVKILDVDIPKMLNMKVLNIELQEGPERGSACLIPASKVLRVEDLPPAQQEEERFPRARRSAKQRRESALLEELCRDHGYAMSMLSPRDTMGPISRRPARCIKLIVPEDSALGRQIVQHARQREREARRIARAAK